jgi:hypothetical protein
MKRYFLFTIIITCSLISCSDLPNIEENPIGYNWEVSAPDELGLDGTMISTAFNEASARGFINTFLLSWKDSRSKYFNGM